VTALVCPQAIAAANSDDDGVIPAINSPMETEPAFSGKDNAVLTLRESNNDIFHGTNNFQTLRDGHPTLAAAAIKVSPRAALHTWLESLDLGQYEDAFVQHHYDMAKV
jgi:hypothetical protein